MKYRTTFMRKLSKYMTQKKKKKKNRSVARDHQILTPIPGLGFIISTSSLT